MIKTTGRSSKYPDNHDNHKWLHKAIPRDDTFKDPEGSAKDLSELRVHMDQLGGGADAMIQPRFPFLLPLYIVKTELLSSVRSVSLVV
jgi:hypothetical protein